MIPTIVWQHRLNRDPRRPWWALLVLVCASAGNSGVAQASDPPDRADLRQRLRAGWQQLHQFDEQLKTYQVAYGADREYPGHERQRTTSRVGVRMDGPNGYRRVESLSAEEGQPATVYARNPQYAFVAVGESAWRLQEIEKGGPDGNRVDRGVLAELNRWTVYPLSTTFVGTPLTDLLADENFQITGSTDADSGKLSVGFRWKYFVPVTREWLPLTGEMLVDPGLSYAVEEWKVAYAGVVPYTRVTCLATRERGGAGPVVCRSITKANAVMKETWEFENYDPQPFSHDPCYLSHYGLPEPVDVPRRAGPMPRYVWFLAAALSAYGLSLGCRRWAKARDKRSG